MKKTSGLPVFVLALGMLAGCAGQPAATEAELSALFSEDSAGWESLNANYQDCVFDWMAQHTGEDCYTDAKELVASAKDVLAEYESLSVPTDLQADADKTAASLKRVVDGDITDACGSGALPDADLPACGDAIPAWVASLDSLVKALDRW